MLNSYWIAFIQPVMVTQHARDRVIYNLIIGERAEEIEFSMKIYNPFHYWWFKYYPWTIQQLSKLTRLLSGRPCSISLPNVKYPIYSWSIAIIVQNNGNYAFWIFLADVFSGKCEIRREEQLLCFCSFMEQVGFSLAIKLATFNASISVNIGVNVQTKSRSTSSLQKHNLHSSYTFLWSFQS